jgi:hypothetical protein
LEPCKDILNSIKKYSLKEVNKENNIKNDKERLTNNVSTEFFQKGKDNIQKPTTHKNSETIVMIN